MLLFGHIGLTLGVARALSREIDARWVAVASLLPDLIDKPLRYVLAPVFTHGNTRTVGHSLTIGAARSWGLYISTGRGMTSAGVEEPALFNEPGVFLVRPDRTLYWAAVQSMPFARPHFRDILGALDFVIAKDYPARGEA